jgi:hypothetical protein
MAPLAPVRLVLALKASSGMICIGICHGTVRVALGSGPLIVSDGPGFYADNAECVWLLEASGPITVVFKSFKTESTDVLSIYEGTDDDAAPRIFSGHDLPEAFTTNATSLVIMFASNGAVHYSGFEIELRALVPGGTWAPTGVPTACARAPARMETAGTRLLTLFSRASP